MFNYTPREGSPVAGLVVTEATDTFNVTQLDNIIHLMAVSVLHLRKCNSSLNGHVRFFSQPLCKWVSCVFPFFFTVGVIMFSSLETKYYCI
uniref:Uncharacterized protein n=1 Tax=Anguilla anguilla TaxID=7936 RepID=A0A0E9XW02_ANGAN